MSGEELHRVYDGVYFILGKKQAECHTKDSSLIDFLRRVQSRREKSTLSCAP